MRGRFYFITSVIMVLCVSIDVKTSYAYLDPGTGSYFFQLMIGALVGGLFAVKLFWGKIVFFFKRLFLRRRDGGSLPHK